MTEFLVGMLATDAVSCSVTSILPDPIPLPSLVPKEAKRYGRAVSQCHRVLSITVSRNCGMTFLPMPTGCSVGMNWSFTTLELILFVSSECDVLVEILGKI